MTDIAEKIGFAINDFRRDPTSVGPTIKKFKTGVEVIDPKSPLIKECTNLQRTLHMIESTPELRVSEDLCRAAEEHLKNCLGGKKVQRVLVAKETKGIVPENFLTDEYTSVFFHDVYEDPERTVIKLLIDKEDPERWGRQFLCSKDITQIGIAVEEDAANDGENSGVVIIFSEDEQFIDEDDELPREGELYLAFKALDAEKKNRIMIKDVCKALDDMGKDDSDPTLYAMLKELEKGGKEHITWKEFSEHFDNRLRDNKSDKGRKEIFEVFKPQPDYKSIGMEELIRIRDYIGAPYTDEQIKTMLKFNEYDKNGVSYDDYVARLEGTAKADEEE